MHFVRCGALRRALAVAVVLTPALAAADPRTALAPDGAASVLLTNRSEPTRCAEEDNVHIELSSPGIERFRVEATHPAYLTQAAGDRTEPDFANCAMAAEAAKGEGEPERVTLYQSAEWELVGLKLLQFWRDDAVPLQVADRVYRGFHLVQLWKRGARHREEVLVLYPGDGYWRMRPLAPAGSGWTAYGSSILLGPVEISGRPVVALRDIAFDPATTTFSLAFVRGGGATVRLAVLDQERAELEVDLDLAEGYAGPFAALRSMWVADINSDASHVAWRPASAEPWRERPIMAFRQAYATDAWIGRRTPSVHNTSAPDIRFTAFRSGDALN